jgi:hypothetical protein
VILLVVCRGPFSDRKENLITITAITFRVDSTTGEGTFIRVLRDGQPFGKILDAAGLYRFYEGDHEKLGGSAELLDADLERLKTAIQSRYAGRGR